ncbi:MULTISPECIES: MazG-like family protein [unclassified Pseudoalteromonas]|uniref:MazG-like family protein n=1 Tax=unclassified Pseudoalteromonas TaxID=194690 RepID=UPI001F243F0B|nr:MULTISPECIES: MazG-like family protein [unclassified Pseudoalteromonas]MCF2828781.1 hypothetical protein [Pseudoalteromonas sp. OF5H-5]MCF2832281.1 hypothetical protein [Pseudoalteromonas sp. DL2-H6]MCF2925047.1 hypothetical protein [Pseudoalteromonas sp. DL2-H1]
MTLIELMKCMHEFVDAKGWYSNESIKPQTEESLAKSVCIEASELLQCYQWKNQANKADVADELADILMYVVQLANVADIDLDLAVKSKLARNYKREWKE